MRRRNILFLLAEAALFVAAYSWPAASQAPRSSGATVFGGARLIIGDGRAPIEDAAFVVENSRITAVGRRGEVTVPAGAARVDLSGKTVMPAIVDAHGHPGFLDAITGQLSKSNFTRENYIDHLERYAYHGVAATISTGTDMGELAYKLRAETIPSAALIRTVGLGLAYPGSGPTDSSRNDVPYAVTSVAEARKAVQDLAPHKPDFVKIWVDSRNGRQQKLTPEMFTAAADEARKHGLPSIAHVFELADAKLLVRAGVEGFLHSIRDQEVDDEFIRLTKDPHTPIYPEDLEAWEKFANVKIESGDAVLVRTGRWALRAAEGPWPQAREAAGLHASVMPWLKKRDIALLGSDAVNDVQPSGIIGGSCEAANRPVHLISIAVMGMPLVDNGYFEDAAKEAAARKRWEFFMTVQLTRLEGGTATNFNALGIF